MKNRLKTWLLVTVVFGITMVAFGAVPGRINFQGRLLDANRNPGSGVFSMTFSIWDAPTGGSQVWSETQNNVQVNNGMFAVQLGAVNPLTSGIFSADTRYLQIQVGEEILTPRERLVTSPYSFRTATAESVIPNAITDTEISPAANIAWSKISKAGSSLADLETRSAADLTSGILPSARLQGNYFNDVKVSSAIYADSAGTVGAHTHSAADITAGTLSAARGGTGISGAGGVANRVLLTTDGSIWSAGQVAPATMIAAGTLPDNVIASSIAVNAVYTGAIRDGAVTDAKITGPISGTKIGSGISAANITSDNLDIARMPTGGNWGITSNLSIAGSTFVITTGGNVGIGTPSPATILHVQRSGAAANIRAVSDGGSTDFEPIVYGDTPRPGISGMRARGTLASPSAVQADDILIFFGGRGHHGGGFPTVSNGAVLVRAAGTFSDTSHPTYLTFETTPFGSTARAERVRITAAGDVGIGTTAPTHKLRVEGGILATSSITANAGFFGDGSALTGITLPQLADVVDFTAAQGDILIRTGTAWDRLPAGTANQVLLTRGPGANPVWGDGIVLLNKAVGAVSVTNTTTETSIYTFNIPAGLLGTNRGLRITIYGTYLNNSGAGTTLTVRVRYGGVTGTMVARTGAIGVGTGTIARAARIEINIHNFNATNAQRSIMNVFLSAIADPPAVTNPFNVTSRTAAAHDTTAAFDLVVTVTHGTAHTAITFTREVVTLELLQ